MKTDDLIRALASDLDPEPPITHRLGLRLGLAIAACVVVVGLTLGFRQDLLDALMNPLSALRLVLTLGVFVAGLQIVLQLARPDGTDKGRYWPLLVLAALAFLSVVWTLIVTPQAGWGAAVRGETMIWCLTTIPALSTIPMTVLFLTLRRGAPTRPGRLGAIAGLVGGSMAAAAYAFHCPEDNPLFYVTWYGSAIAAVTALSAMIGSRLLRW